MRILYLSDIRFPLERANGIQTMETCWVLAERGHEVTLLVRPDTVHPPRDPFAFYGVAPQPRLAIARARVAGPMTARRVVYLAKALAVASRRRRWDVVLTRDLGVADALLRLPRWLRPPVVYECHGLAATFSEELPEMLSDARPASRRKRQRLLRREARVWQKADGYAVITAGLLEDLTARFGRRHQVARVPDGARVATNRRFRFSRPSGPPIVAYAGHLYPWKGVEVLLEALARLPGVQGLIVGGHPAEGDLERLRRFAERLGLSERVTFTGWTDPSGVHEHLVRADVLVLPNTRSAVSARYTSPLKLFEYMAAGKPIVASDLPAIREVLRDGEHACLVRPGDPAALAAGIRRVLEDPVFAERIARCAFDEAGNYSWAKRAERLEALLADVVASS